MFAVVLDVEGAFRCVRGPEGSVVGASGNSGNSTQPYLHIQATDSTDWDQARGLPIAFRTTSAPALPAESEIVSI